MLWTFPFPLDNFRGKKSVPLELRTKLWLPRSLMERCGFISLWLFHINRWINMISRMREFGLCLKHTPEVSALKMRFLCLLPGHKIFSWVFFPRERSLVPSSDKGQGPRSWKGTAGHKPTAAFVSQVRWIHLPQGRFLQPNTSFVVAIWRRNQEWAAHPLMKSSGVNLHPVPPNPKIPAESLNHVLPASRKHPEFLSHSFPQHTRGVLLKCNTYMAFHLINTFHLEID